MGFGDMAILSRTGGQSRCPSCGYFDDIYDSYGQQSRYE
jgi:hypothetical protein